MSDVTPEIIELTKNYHEKMVSIMKTKTSNYMSSHMAYTVGLIVGATAILIKENDLDGERNKNRSK